MFAQRARVILICTLWAPMAGMAQGAADDGDMAFSVSMPQAAAHKFHVAFRCQGLHGQTQDFKMPVWTPGFYRVLDFAKNVANFRAEDGEGRALAWEKITKNTWRVATGNARVILVNYDVDAPAFFVARSYVDDTHAFIAPAGLFVYVAGQIRHPVVVGFQMPAGWRHISTGLDPVSGAANTFSAPDFDTLYDSPFLLGNQEILQFDVAGRTHSMAIENVPAGVNREQMTSDLKRMVEASTRLMGDMPYRHYTFLLMGKGNGGIEHSNSAAISFNGESLTKDFGYARWLSYVAHEYFHNFNVKRIRPLALGPFDYDQENLTDMLWVSEGLSVYYEDLVLVRAGLLTPAGYLERMAGAMTKFENSPGHRYQSAAESSLHTWGTSGVGGDRATTISYYDNGAMLGALLDLKIRKESQNRKSLDDVMRALYRDYYQQKGRGFTDAEFRAECEKAIGGPLDEFFDYVASSREMDYAKYFDYAGLRVEIATEEAPGAYLGINTRTDDDGLTITDVAAGSPAANAGLSAHDRIVSLDGAAANPKSLNDRLTAKTPGDTVKMRYVRNGTTQEVEIVLGKNMKATYKIAAADQPGRLQAVILKDWLRKQP